jgi:hypothetical protein
MPHTQRTFEGLQADLPAIREKIQPKSLLYVGWRHDCKPWWYDTMCKELGIDQVSVLEIFPKNVADLELKVWEGRYDLQVHRGDVMQYAYELFRHDIKDAHDIIFWDHGPEHVNDDDLIQTTRMLKNAAKLLIYCCPWGLWPQDATDNNEHEIHRTTVTQEMLEGFGFEVKMFGQPGQEGEGELLAYFYR